MSSPVLYLVVPAYNEEQALPVSVVEFKNKLTSLIKGGKISEKSRILFVDDGSQDNTFEIIKNLAASDSMVCGISLSKNCGHQNALLAGLMHVKDKCDCAVSIDCDGQDDINAVDDMVDAFLNGCDVVYGVRNDRSSDSFLKRHTAQGFYKFMNKMGCETVYNHADYRLLSNKVLCALSQFKEVNIYLRGMVPLVGFKSTSVYYKRNERVAGKSHYPVKKMAALAINGITNLSVKPIHMITVFGFFVSLLSFVGILWAIVNLLIGHTVAGWASTVCIICFISGVQLISLGVIGEYVAKTYLETKARPRYIIDKDTDNIE